LSEPYIPPFSELDPPPHELIVLFLEAVARVTPAFQELRDSVLSHTTKRTEIHKKSVSAWIERWHLNFENYELRERVEGWVYEVLDWWLRDPEARQNLKIDIGCWDNSTRHRSTVLPLGLKPWNPEQECFEAYTAAVKRLLHEQKREGEAVMERFDMRPYLTRERDSLVVDGVKKPRPKEWTFEWLALRVCNGWSDAQIANRLEYKGVKSDAVKKARRALEKSLKMTLVGS